MHEKPPPTSLKTSFDPMARPGIWKKSARKLRQTWASWGAVDVRFISYVGSRFLKATYFERWDIQRSFFLFPLLFKFFVLITIQNSINVHFDLTKIYSRGEWKRPVWSGIARLSYDRIPDEGTHPSLQNNGILHWNSGDLETSWCFFFLQLVLWQKHSLNPQKPHISKPSTKGIHNLFFQFLAVSVASEFSKKMQPSAPSFVYEIAIFQKLSHLLSHPSTMWDPHFSSQRPRPTSSSLMLPSPLTTKLHRLHQAWV